MSKQIKHLYWAWIVSAAAACTGFTGTTPAHAQQAAGCGDLANAYGPFDYRSEKKKLGVVEQYHFTPSVEALVRGVRSASVGGDLAYTLRAFPNHHRALLAMVRYGEKTKSDQPRGANYTVECYLERALRFQPDDVVARLIYVHYLITNKRATDASAQLQSAETYAENDGYAHFYMGMLYLELKDYARALAHAHKAHELQYDMSELREALNKAGHWSEPAPKPAAQGSVATPAKP